MVTGISSTLAGAGIGASIGWFTCGGLSGNLDLACLARETAAGAAGGMVAAIPGVGILGGLGVAGGAGVAESLVRQGMQGGIDPLQVGIDGMLSAATFGIARHTLGPLVQRLRGAHLTNQTGPVSIQPGSHLAAPRGPTARLQQDVAVNPTAPRPLPLNRPVSGSPTQNAFVQDRLAALRAQGARDFRVNQQQVDVNGVRVGINRPDLQYTLNGQRFYEEFDTRSSLRGYGHAERIFANDPYGIIRLFTVD